MDRQALREMINRPEGRPGVLSTTDEEGQVNAAVFGSARLTDDGLLLLGLGENRSLANLRQQPQAVFTFFDPGAQPSAWTGARLYLEVARIDGEGQVFDRIVEGIRQVAGARAARRIRAAVLFRIVNIRPLVDLFS